MQLSPLEIKVNQTNLKMAVAVVFASLDLAFATGKPWLGLWFLFTSVFLFMLFEGIAVRIIAAIKDNKPKE